MLQNRRVITHDRLVPDVGHLVQIDEVVVEPLPVGMLDGHRVLDLVVGDDAPHLRVDEEHAPGLQATLVQHVAGVDVQDTDL